MFRVEVKSETEWLFLESGPGCGYMWAVCGIWDTYEEAACQLAWLAFNNGKEYRIREE